MSATIERLMKMPDLPNVLQEANRRLDEERRRRQDFYEWVQDDQKAEFIFGEIVLHSPAADEHTDTVGYTFRVTSVFADVQLVGKVKSEKAIIGLTRNDYEPDIAFWRKEIADQFQQGQAHFPAPDFIVEVLSKGSVKNDRVTKFKDYAAHGVSEYWIVDPRKRIVEQYVLPVGKSDYFLLRKLTADDDIESHVLKGFRIPVLAIFDAAANVEALKNLVG